MFLNSFEVKFSHPSELPQKPLLSIICDAFDQSEGEDVKAAFLVSDSGDDRLTAVTVGEQKKIYGVAFAKQTTITCRGAELSALTVGAVAVARSQQGRGIGKTILAGLDALAKALSIDVIYLQGIPNFYEKFGYIPFLPRTKIQIASKSIRKSSLKINIRTATHADKQELAQIYESMTTDVQGAAKRTEADWGWLLGPASRSKYFYSPKIVEVENEVVGYFCQDRKTLTRVREIGYKQSHEAISSVLAAIKDATSDCDEACIEIMTWFDSPLHRHTTCRHDSSFVELSQRSGGMLIKIVDATQKIRALVIDAVVGARKEVLLEQKGLRLEIVSGGEKLSLESRYLAVWLFGIIPISDLMVTQSTVQCQESSRASLMSDLDDQEDLRRPTFIFQGDNL